MSPCLRRSLYGAGAVVLLGGLGWVFHPRILAAAGGFLVQAESPVRADVALVLAGDFTGNRILRGAELVRVGLVARAVVSGPTAYYDQPESDAAVAFAGRAGYPEDYFIRAPHRAMSTAEEAEVLVPLLRRLRASQVLLVTSDYHTRRAGKLFRETAPDLRWRVVAAPSRYFTPWGWWHNREGRKIVFYEWTKTVATWAGW